MPSLYTFSSSDRKIKKSLSPGERLSVVYHNIFDFPLTYSELIKWKINEDKAYEIKTSTDVIQRNGYYFVGGNEGSVYKRSLHKRISARKMLIAKKAANILSLIPTVKMVGITGSLAMENSNEESDIDLLIITKQGTLWTTRLIVYSLLNLLGVGTRKSDNKNQKDKLCLNMWLDESDLVWSKKDRNLYTAHEIAQIIPLVNKERTYENFINQNKWINDFWPNVVGIKDLYLEKGRIKRGVNFFSVIEKFSFGIQYKYMKSKITREVIAKTRAFFHPQDWGEVVLKRLDP